MLIEVGAAPCTACQTPNDPSGRPVPRPRSQAPGCQKGSNHHAAMLRKTPSRHTDVPNVAHLLEGLNVPDEVLKCVQPLLHREREFVMDGAQEVSHLRQTKWRNR